MEAAQQILFLHFSASETERLVAALQASGLSPGHARVEPGAAFDPGSGWPWDVVLLRHRPGGPTVQDVLDRFGSGSPRPRLVVLADEAGVRDAVAAMRAGAADYLPWEDRDRLPEVLAGALAVAREREDRQCDDRFIQFAQYSIVNSAEAVLWADALGRIFYANPAAERLTGYGRAELERQRLADLAPGVLDDDWPALVQRLREERGLLREMDLLARGGRLVPTELLLGHMECDGRDVVTALVRDTTERKRVERALAEEESRYRSLFEDSPISLWEEDLSGVKRFVDDLRRQGVADFDAHFRDHPDDLLECVRQVRVINVNKATVRMLEAESKEQLLGGLDKVFTEDSLRVAHEEFRDLAHGRFSYHGELEHRTMRGRIIRVAVHFNVAPEYRSTLGRVVVSLIDVTRIRMMQRELEQARSDLETRVDERTRELTEANRKLRREIGDRKEVERRLRSNERRLRLLVDSLPVVIHAHDADGNYVFWNRECERLLGFSAKDVLGGSWVREKLYPDPEYRAWIESVHNAGEFDELELDTATRDGGERVIHWTNMTRRSPIPGWSVWEAGIDLTDVRRAEHRVHTLTGELFRAQEDERRRIALELHDNIAQNLSSLKIGCETLFDGEDVSDAVRTRSLALAGTLDACINAVRDMSYDLLPPGLDQLGLARALDQFCREYSQSSGVAVELSLAGVEHMRMGYDADINLYRLVQEALRNAVRHGRPARVEVKLVASSPHLILRVEDDGCGFDVAARRAETHKERRMGLHTMEERAKLLGGTFRITSVVDKGTRIFVQIPYGEHKA